MTNIRSNAMRGPYMREFVDKTIQEIHDNLVTVFGPYATDAYLTNQGQPYYTRDGKETIRLMQFDNKLSMYILKIMYQAVAQQGEKVGDGTTTLAVLYTNLYRYIRSYLESNPGKRIDRNDWNRVIARVNERIRSSCVEMDYERLKQMLFTCTQDEELTAKIYWNLRAAIMEHAYITIAKSNIADDFVMTVHETPMIRVTKQFSILPIHDREERCVVLHCNGMLDIAHPEVILDLMSRVDRMGDSFVPKTVILLCNGVTDATRRTLKEVNRSLHALKGDAPLDKFFSEYNNVAIYTLTDYRSYDPKMVEDISTLITDEQGIGGLVNQLSFESLLHQALGNPQNPIEELQRFDADPHHIEKLKEIFSNAFPIEFDEMLGMKMLKTPGPVAQNRYEQLRKEIEEEKSGVKRIQLQDRLRTMYGKFIEVEIGSNLMKDSQRKYELVLDAVLSSSEAVEHGVLTHNSILEAIRSVILDWTDQSSDIDEPIEGILATALMKTFEDMLRNRWSDVELVTEADMVTAKAAAIFDTKNLDSFNLRTATSFDEIMTNTNEPGPAPVVHRLTIGKTDSGDDITVEFEEHIVEPVSIITTMLENSTLMLELAQAKTFQIDDFMENFI